MCFKNLPIEFDESGQARLTAGWELNRRSAPADPLEPLISRRQLREFDVDPITRIAGAMSLHTVVDLEARRVVESRVEAPLFRGYEVILKDRDPLEAVHISSRACGVCGGVHATCAAMALEMAYGIVPPPLALIARNLGEGAELLYDHTLHLFLLAGPDYSEVVVRRTSPSLWSKAERAEAPNAEIHGLKTMGDIMRGLNPLTGPLYLEGLAISRAAREIASLMLGKYPHPSTIFPGGLGTEANTDVFNQVLGRIVRLLDYSKKVVGIWDDLADFILQELPDYKRVGHRRANFVCTGIWDRPEAYDASYENASEWGESRLVTPGAIVDGELRTTKLSEINVGVEEFIDHSYYERWAGDLLSHDPRGTPLSPYHPWNKETIPKPSGRNWRERYTWSTAPRWDREAMESGPLGRHWVTALAGKLDTEFIRVIPGGIQIDLPKGQTPARVVEWRIPEMVNALERNRARAYHIAYCGMVSYTYLLAAFKKLGEGKTQMASRYEPKRNAVGLGFWEAGRGSLMHYVIVEDWKIRNYQILTPSTWMASPADAFGNLGPYDEAILNTPILEEFERPEQFTGIDILRTVRSFDPCMPCTVHMMNGDRVIERDATSCACGIEEAHG